MKTPQATHSKIDVMIPWQEKKGRWSWAAGDEVFIPSTLHSNSFNISLWDLTLPSNSCCQLTFVMIFHHAAVNLLSISFCLVFFTDFFLAFTLYLLEYSHMFYIYTLIDHLWHVYLTPLSYISELHISFYICIPLTISLHILLILFDIDTSSISFILYIYCHSIWLTLSLILSQILACTTLCPHTPVSLLLNGGILVIVQQVVTSHDSRLAQRKLVE